MLMQAGDISRHGVLHVVPSFLSGGSDTSTVNGGHTFLAGNGTVVTTLATDAVDPLASYVGHPFMALKFQTTSALGAIKSALHQEADHSPCFNPSGLFPTVLGAGGAGSPPGVVPPNSPLFPTCQGW